MKPLPAYLAKYWGKRIDDPRDYPGFCARQARKTPAIPWHAIAVERCKACGKGPGATK